MGPIGGVKKISNGKRNDLTFHKKGSLIIMRARYIELMYIYDMKFEDLISDFNRVHPLTSSKLTGNMDYHYSPNLLEKSVSLQRKEGKKKGERSRRADLLFVRGKYYSSNHFQQQTSNTTKVS